MGGKIKKLKQTRKKRQKYQFESSKIWAFPFGIKSKSELRRFINEFTFGKLFVVIKEYNKRRLKFILE